MRISDWSSDVCSSETVEAAAAALATAERPLLICGGGPVIAGARGEVTALAERLGAVVATSISGQGAILDSHPLALGVVGSNGGSRSDGRPGGKEGGRTGRVRR